MRWLGCALAAVVLAAGPVLALPAWAQSGERILDYHVDLRIDASGELLVQERISYDFGGQWRHGILRDLPVGLRWDDRNDRLYPVQVVGVHASADTPDQYQLEDVEGDEGPILRIRIGDPDQTISGQHDYIIDYRVQGALDGFTDHDELFWNAVGTRWKVPIGRASATVTAPASITHVACHSGPSGSRRPCTSVLVDGRTASFAAADLAPAEGLLVGVGFPVGVVPTPRPILAERWSLARAFAVTPASLGLTGGLLVVVLVLAGVVAVAGRNRRVAASSGVEAAPPADIRAGEAGLLVDKTVTPEAMAATVVDLAARGYLRVEQFPSAVGPGGIDWRLVQLRDADEGLRGYERVLLGGLFGRPLVGGKASPGASSSESSSGAGTAVVEEDLASVQLSSLQSQFRERFERVRSALSERAVHQGWFAARPDRVRRVWAWGGVAVVVVGVGLTVLLAWRTHLGLVPAPMLGAGLAMAAAARWMPKWTPYGAELAGRVRGFRNYLEGASVSAARSVDATHLVSMHLPFWIVFGHTQGPTRASVEVDAASPAEWYQGQAVFAVGEFCSSMKRLVSWRARLSQTQWFGGLGGPGRDRSWDRGDSWGSAGSSGWSGSSSGGSDGGGGGGGGDSW